MVLIEGDCLPLLQEFEAKGERFDAIITSPPYNLGNSSGAGVKNITDTSLWSACRLGGGYANHNDAMSAEDYGLWQKEVLRSMWNCLSDNGAIFYNHKPRIQHGEVTLPTEYNPGLPLRQVIIWDRGSRFNFSPTFFCPQHEWIMVFAKPDFRLNNQKASAIGDVWRIPPTRKEPHPISFPEQLVANILENIPAQTVLDPFMGQGTVGKVCKRLGMDFTGIDSDPHFVNVAKEHIGVNAV